MSPDNSPAPTTLTSYSISSPTASVNGISGTNHSSSIMSSTFMPSGKRSLPPSDRKSYPYLPACTSAYSPVLLPPFPSSPNRSNHNNNSVPLSSKPSTTILSSNISLPSSTTTARAPTLSNLLNDDNSNNIYMEPTFHACKFNHSNGKNPLPSLHQFVKSNLQVDLAELSQKFHQFQSSAGRNNFAPYSNFHSGAVSALL